MTVYFDDRRKRWTYDFRKNGARYSGYADDPVTGDPAKNKTDAKRIEELIKADVIRNQKVTASSDDLILARAFSAFAARKQGGANWENQRVYIRDLLSYFGPMAAVRQIDEQAAWDYIAWARQQPIMVYIGAGKPRSVIPDDQLPRYYRPRKDGKTRADSTINRYLDCLREALRIAYGLRGPDGLPLVPGEIPKIPELAEPEHLPRPISDDDLKRIVDAAPPHLGEAIMLARLMGFRKGEVMALTIGQVDFVNKGVWIEAKDTKANRDELMPASTEAMRLLERLVGQARERKTEYLITYKHGSKEGTPYRPVKNPRRSWQTCLKKLGLEGAHTFHNTKASFVTAIAHHAAPAVTQKLARHKDYRTTERYLRVHEQATRDAVEAATPKPRSPRQNFQTPKNTKGDA